MNDKVDKEVNDKLYELVNLVREKYPDVVYITTSWIGTLECGNEDIPSITIREKDSDNFIDLRPTEYKYDN